MVDPRCVMGNPVWAKALHVSRDCRRIYGADVDKLWIEGIVLECMISKPDGARRATTLIKAKYTVGNGERVKIINISQLKKDNPNPWTKQEERAARSSSATSSPENLEQSSASQELRPATNSYRNYSPGRTRDSWNSRQLVNVIFPASSCYSS
jgi:hypothetical protein